MYGIDIAKQLLSLTKLFSDDSSHFISCFNLNDIEGILNHDLKIISAWAKQWLVNFNPKRTVAMFFFFNETRKLARCCFLMMS